MKRLVLLCIATALLAASVAWYSHRSSMPMPTVVAGSQRVDRQTCAECHPGIVAGFADAPHSHTLRPGDDPELVERFAGQSIELNGQRFSFQEVDDALWFHAEGVPYASRVDWVFGSGQHALTPVTLDTDPQGRPRLTQLHASHFGSHGLARTPGSTQSADAPPSIGMPADAEETRRCFGCHVSWLPERDERVDLERMIPNVGCARCHHGAAAHAASDGQRALEVDWDALTPLQSINRCGECHRRVDEFTVDELTVSHKHLIRFAPVGLALSPCFQRSNDPADQRDLPRFDCISCHDPHAPAQSDPEFFNDVCRDCHGHVDEAHHSDGALPCSVRPADSNCLPCHMPKVELQPGLAFTDHWIRVREPTRVDPNDDVSEAGREQ